MAWQIKMKIWPLIDFIMLNNFIHVRIWLNLMFFEIHEKKLMAKPNYFEEICKKLQPEPYILFLGMVATFFNGTKITAFVQDTLRNICAKFYIIPLRSFKGKAFWNIVNGRQRQRMPSDGNSSLGLWPGKLKRGCLKTLFTIFWRSYT